jgi:hypothetical protein
MKSEFPRCKTCKFWEKNDFMPPRTCIHKDLGEGRDVYVLNGNEVVPFGNALTYSYREGGAFHPGPDFGCVHHEEK